MGLVEEKNVFYTENGAKQLWDEELATEKEVYLALQEKIKLRQAILEQVVLVPDFYMEIVHHFLLSLNAQIQQNNLDKEKIYALFLPKI
jgi:sulfur relay (sulfurtransferase) DsrC/TusE family protein